MSAATLHEADRFEWLEQQVGLLKSGALGALDITHLIQELESEMGNERRELFRRLRMLMAHLLKWQFQPELDFGHFPAARRRKSLKNNW